MKIHTPSASAFEVQNRELAALYLAWQRDVNRISKGTVHDYAGRIERFLTFIGGTPLSQVTTEQVEAWIQRPRPGRAMGQVGSAASLSKDVSTLRTMFNFLCGRHGLPYNPCASGVVGRTKIRNKMPKPIPLERWVRIWDSDMPDATRVALGAGFFVGLRSEEVVDLGPAHVSLFSRSLVGFVRKGGGEDITPYGDMVDTFADLLPQVFGAGGPESFLEPLHRLAQERAGQPRLLPWREEYDRGGVGWGAKKASMRKNELEPNEIPVTWFRTRLRPIIKETDWHFTPHMLRHSCCTYLLMAGVPIHIVSVLLNHSSIAVTMRYTKAGGGELRHWRSGITAPTARDLEVVPLRADFPNVGR